MFSKVLNGLPVVGHAKAFGHLVIGDKEGAKNAFCEATRSTVVIAGGAVGCVAGPGGAVGLAMAAGMVTDTVTSIVTNEPRGIIEGFENIASDIEEGNVPLKSIAKTGLMMTTDAVCGLGAGGVTQVVKSVGKETGKSVTQVVVKEVVKAAANKEVQQVAGSVAVRSLCSDDDARLMNSYKSRNSVNSISSAIYIPTSNTSSNSSGARATNSGSNTSSSAAGGSAGQNPRDNENNKKNRKKRSGPSQAELNMAIFLTIFNVGSLDDVTMGRPGINIFMGLSDGQIKTLRKLIKNLLSDGYMEEVIKIVLRIFNTLDVDDVDFPNFLSFAEFVAVYIGEYLEDNITSNTNELYPERRQQLIVNIRQNIDNFTERILTRFNELRDEINVENNRLSTRFRNVYCAVYHWYKHRNLPNGQSLTIKEYFEWIVNQYQRLRGLRVYSQLIDNSYRRQAVAYEIYSTVFGRRIKIVVKVQDGILVLSSLFVVEGPIRGDEEGDEFIDGKWLAKNASDPFFLHKRFQ